MVRSRLHGCTINNDGAYQCMFSTARRVLRVYWNPIGVSMVRTDGDATWQMGLDGVRRPPPANGRLFVGSSPVAVRSAS